jgi:DNA-binding MarR family transcriptional regulator
VDTSRGAELATLLLGGFTAMVDEVVVELDRRGHPGVTASHEFALQAIDAGARNAAELGRTLGVSRQAAAKSIVALEELGYLERQSDPSDGRQKQLIVTDRGYEMVRIGAAVFDQIRARWSKQLGRAQLDLLESSLRALVAPEREPTPSSGKKPRPL